MTRCLEYYLDKTNKMDLAKIIFNNIPCNAVNSISEMCNEEIRENSFIKSYMYRTQSKLYYHQDLLKLLSELFNVSITFGDKHIIIFGVSTENKPLDFKVTDFNFDSTSFYYDEMKKAITEYSDGILNS